MSSKKNVIVLSARRSGTHLLTDLIVNNFGYQSINYNYIDYPKFNEGEMEDFESSMNEGGKVTWTHSHDFKDYYKFTHTNDIKLKLDKFFSESKIILVYRDIRDIITSCYHRPRTQKKYKSFTHFFNEFDFDGYELVDQKYNNIFDLLLQYYKNWFSVFMAKELIDLDMEVISFEEIVQDYETSLNKIGKFLKKKPSGIDVRLPNENTKNVIYTTNDFRKGKVNDWVSTMEKKFGETLGKTYYHELGAGLDCFLKDIQVHKYHKPLRDEFYKKAEFDTKKNSLSSDIDYELKKYNNKFDIFNEKTSIELIKNRYRDCVQKSNDFRYYHKVFYYDKYILKFHYPCKASLDKETFDTTIPTASKQQLLTILKTDDILYQNDIVPKLYYAGIYKGVLYVIQERYDEENIINYKYKFHPKWGDWNWVIDLNLKKKMLTHFYNALNHNILLTDIFNAYNCAFDSKGNLKYFDLDGIKYYETNQEMVNTEEYRNIIGIIGEIE